MEPITISLPVEQWNGILTALSARPFAEVAALISEIQKQAQGQIQPPSAVEPATALEE